MLPLTKYTQQTPDHKKTISPPHLEIYFRLDSGATRNILNNDTSNDIKEYHKLQLKATTFLLSAANNTKLQLNGIIKITLYSDVTEKNSQEHLIYTQISCIKHKI